MKSMTAQLVHAPTTMTDLESNQQLEEMKSDDSSVEELPTSELKMKKTSCIPTPPPLPPIPLHIAQQKGSNWSYLKMSQQQAEARNLVLNEIKALQLQRQSSFRRILKLPNWGSGENRSYQIKNSPLVVSQDMNQSSNGISTTDSAAKDSSPMLRSQGSTSKLWDKRNQASALPSHMDKENARSSNRVDRSQSCKLEKKEPKRGATRERRKHSDPNIPRSTTSDADSDAAIQTILDHHPSGSSSSSSLSRSSLDSPATSMQDMAGRGAASALASGDVAASTASTSSSQFPSSQSYWDSDFETEPDPPDWRHSINQEELNQLNPREKKRQDVINEFFHTEKSHVRNLKVLDRLFFRPLLESNIMPKELLEQLFPNLEEVLALHNQYNQKMKERAKAGFPVGNIGDMLCEMFEGPMGDSLVQVGAEFTKNQKWSIEELKERRKRDQKLELFLNETERRPECRRLGLQAQLPVEHQRLVKYPLLLEQLAKQCDKDDEEYVKVRRCVDRSREILESIDRQVAEAQNIQKLAEIQRNLDTSGLEKMSESAICTAICTEYRNVDLTKHRLIYDGPLTLKLGDTKRFKTIDLHVVLLEDCIMLLQKQDDKYLLKFHTSTMANAAGGGSQGHKFCHSPVIKFCAMLVRPVATDKRAFYLLNTTQNGPQIYELVASSTADRTQWFRHISEASAAYKARDNSRRGRYPAASGTDPLNGLEGSVGKTDDHLGIPDLDKKGQPAGRSQSFHEQSTSSREPHPERQPSSPPEETSGGDPSAKKAGEMENGSKNRVHRVDILKIAEPCPLIDPSQVVVTQGEILVADPVLTPIEKIRRKDLEVAQALEEKHRLLAEYYHLPFDEAAISTESEESATSGGTAAAAAERDARDVLLAALVLQVKSLSDLVNESLSLSEEDAVAAAAVTSSRLSPPPTKSEANTESEAEVPTLSALASEAIDELPSVKLLKRLQPPTHKLIAITKSMNQHLTSLLEIIQDRDEERDRLRKELQRTRAMLSSEAAVRTSSLSVTSPPSRPASFISVEESSASERNQESEDDGASNTTPTATSQVTEAAGGDSTPTKDEPTPGSSIDDQDDDDKKTIEMENTEDDSAV